MASHPEEQTEVVDTSYFDTVTFHNRLFQRYALQNYTYYQPIDEDEIERLRIESAIFHRVFENRLIFPPLTRPRRILDCGYGTADWAVDVATRHPRCEVIAVDVYPFQPETMPENLYLQVDDLNSRFTFPAHNFDLVHSRMMATGIHINRWTEYLRDIFRVVRPGGWCQMVELYYNVQSDNGQLTDGEHIKNEQRSGFIANQDTREAHALRQWSTTYLQSLGDVKDLRVPLRLQNLMREAGFVDTEQRMIPMHTCGWSTDPRQREIGTANRDNVHRFLSSLAVYPFTEKLGMPIQDVQLLIAQARLEADDPALKAYFSLYVCIGRKPRSR